MNTLKVLVISLVMVLVVVSNSLSYKGIDLHPEYKMLSGHIEMMKCH